MIEGRTTKTFSHAKALLYQNPGTMHRLLEKLTMAVTAFLRAQVEAGAQALQLFDSWAGFLPDCAWREFSLSYNRKIFAELRETGVPLIYFSKGTAHQTRAMAMSGAHVLSLDWTISLAQARRLAGPHVALQGNLDPSALYADPHALTRAAHAVLADYGTSPGHIFNLGHGIAPDVPWENARHLVEVVHGWRPTTTAGAEQIWEAQHVQ
jgi:uroporphyrinogen decarboxylase